ncbi:hypothetical protein B9N43_15470 [Denitratisoma sp. DHT3]|uniref:hypothetical protein n=1 Tax=Denitratisoma sp. DHT3 TaxID=1981880 RepID=UPI001198C615|nr:hypothetical protein [Denitratisoma sp. DHT3]QDX82510.1 hypothetical protein B9N43_15470 [Denitratisoma sp. DHT3]
MEFFDRLSHWLAPAPPLARELESAIDHAVEAPQLKVLSDYRRQLAPAVERALDYCADLVGAIPGPHAIGPAQFAADPLIHAFFGSSETIATTLARSEGVRAFLKDTPGGLEDICYGLLGMRSHQKSVMGSAMMGDVIRHDVPQTLLYFSDHTVSSLAADLDSVRRQLRQTAFDSLLRQFGRQLSAMRERRDAMTTALSTRRGTPDAGEIEQDLERLRRQLAPESQLVALARWLAAPEQALYLKQVPRMMDRMGVLLPPESAPSNGERIVFPELAGRDRRRWTVLLVGISRAQALAAVAREERAHRYIVI